MKHPVLGSKYHFNIQFKHNILDPVVATTTPTSITVNEGNTIRIQCDVSGNPTPFVTWQHKRLDGVTVPGKPVLV